MLTLQHRKLHSNTELPASECYTQTLNDQPLNVGTQNLICKFDLCKIQKISWTSPTPTTFKNLLKLWSLVEGFFLVFSRKYNISKVFIHHHFALQVIWVKVFQFQVKLQNSKNTPDPCWNYYLSTNIQSSIKITYKPWKDYQIEIRRSPSSGLNSLNFVS